MSTSIGSLWVGITANTSGFHQGMQKASHHVQEFGHHVVEVREKVSHLFEGLVVAAAGAGLAELFHQSLEGIDKIGKLSDRIGVTTEQLMGLKLAASYAGVGFDDLSTTVGKLEKNLGQPTKQVEASLERMGLAVSDLVGKGAEKQLEIISDRFKRLGSDEERAAVAVALFGRTGQMLIPMLLEGSKGLREASEQSERLGAAFSRVDAQKVEFANEAMIRLKTAVTAVVDKLSIASAPYLEALADGITDVIVKFGGADAVVAAVFAGIANSIMLVGKAINFMSEGIDRLKVVAAYLQERFSAVLAARENSRNAGGLNQEAADDANAMHEIAARQLGDASTSLFTNNQERANGTDAMTAAVTAALEKFKAITTSATDRANSKLGDKVIDKYLGKIHNAYDNFQAHIKAAANADKSAQDQLRADRRAEQDGMISSVSHAIDRSSPLQHGLDAFKPWDWGGATSNVGLTADHGTRGTFASGAFDRMNGAESIPAKQLKALEGLGDKLDTLHEDLAGGIALAP